MQNYYYIEIPGNVEAAADKIALTLFSKYSAEKEITAIKAYVNHIKEDTVVEYLYSGLGEFITFEYV